MGKASRVKKVNRMALAERPGWQEEASRQRRERRQDEVKQHNSIFEATMVKFNALEPGGHEIMIVDGVQYMGKEAIKEAVKEAYDLWVRNEILNDDPSKFDEIAALGTQLQTSIWAAKISLDEPTILGEVSFNPLTAAFVLDSVNCFAWLLEHAYSHLDEAAGVISELLMTVLFTADQFDPNSVRWANARLLMRTSLARMSDVEKQNLVKKMPPPDVVGGAAVGVMRHYFAELTAAEEQREIRATVTPPDAGLLLVANPDAVELDKDAGNDPVYQENSHRPRASGAKRL